MCVYVESCDVIVHRAKAIQKLLERLNTPQQISLVMTSLLPGAFALAIDSNGQHIINYCVKRFPGEYTKVIEKKMKKTNVFFELLISHI